MALEAPDPTSIAPATKVRKRETKRRAGRRSIVALFCAGAALALAGGAAARLTATASTIEFELNAATRLINPLKQYVSSNDVEQANRAVEQLRSHTTTAKNAAADPVWTLASALPLLGPNLSAVTEVARSADDVTSLGLVPLVTAYGALDWEALIPSSNGSNLVPLQKASPTIASAAHAVRMTAQRLDAIDTTGLLPKVAEPVTHAQRELQNVTSTLDAAANASRLVPGMLGADGVRNYLLIVQNNAESRASGGIPGALAVLTLENGKLTLGRQSSASQIGVTAPSIAADAEQTVIYSGRLGKFIQDVNLTPDFPTAAGLAQAMWEEKTGQRVDGVVSVDPVVLSYILEATGAVYIDSPQAPPAQFGMPTELNSKNVIPTLLSDVYAKIEDPQGQDAYFAAVAQEIFVSLSGGAGDAKQLLAAISRGVEDGRILLWSDVEREQSILDDYAISGSIAGPSLSPAEFGVYFNDGTGAKMDYYVKRTVQLIKECAKDGYEQTTVRVTSTNTAPADAATSLPAYVTGDGHFGVPPGSVQTNIVAYGPVQAQVETAKLDGQKTEFAPYIHSDRPVGILAVRLAPGESRAVDFRFGKIVQHTEPNVVVTPTVQDVKDVTLPTETAVCS